jgi:hypothetical protein
MACPRCHLFRLQVKRLIDREISRVKAEKKMEIEKGLFRSNTYWLHAADEKIGLLKRLPTLLGRF